MSKKHVAISNIYYYIIYNLPNHIFISVIIFSIFICIYVCKFVLYCDTSDETNTLLVKTMLLSMMKWWTNSVVHSHNISNIYKHTSFETPSCEKILFQCWKVPDVRKSFVLLGATIDLRIYESFVLCDVSEWVTNRQKCN